MKKVNNYNAQQGYPAIKMGIVINTSEIKYSIIKGKYAGAELHNGKIVKLSETFLDIQTGTKLEKFSNLKISINIYIDKNVNAIIYAKVVQYHVYQTSIF